jgi:Protein of unknown function (DUF1569)
MENLFDAATRAAIAARLQALQPGHVRQWGKMSAPQMLAHCSVGLEFACGERSGKQAFIGKLVAPFVKGRFLGEKPFGKNAPTGPEFVIADDRNFGNEKARLASLIDTFASRGPEVAGKQVHTFFGQLTGDEWGRLMYKHLDHHLRQFGA